MKFNFNFLKFKRNYQDKKNDKLQKRFAAVQKELAQIEVSYYDMKERLSNDLFIRVKEAINKVAKSLHPSSSNGTMNQFVNECEQVFASFNIKGQLYWCEVWLRNGRKNLANYNPTPHKSIDII